MSRDLLLRCAECGSDFAWTAAEQATAPQPTRCPACRLIAPEPGRGRGIVKWFSHSKGYGFITPTAGADLFVHKSGLTPGQPTLRAGQLVEFCSVATPRGITAEAVIALQDDPA